MFKSYSEHHAGNSWRKPAALVCLAIILGCSCAFTQAAEFDVNDTADEPDVNPGDGICEATAKLGDCTLRAAIMETNALGTADVINVPAGTYVLDIDGTDDTGTLGDLDIEYDEVSIHGAGAASTILDAGGIDRFFQVWGSTVTIEDVTIQNGVTDADSNVGGAISVVGLGPTPSNLTVRRARFINNGSHLGGAIRSTPFTTILIEDSLFSGNETIAGASNRTGAAIYCQGCEITLDRCLLTNNGDDLSGKIVVVDGNGQLNILNSTISGNPFGGGVSASNGNVLIKFSTLMENNAQNLSFFSHDDSHDFEVFGSVLQNSTHDNCQAGSDLPVSLGYNIVGDMSCAFSSTGDMEDTAAMLGALSDNGGPTLTHLPQPGSPVLDHVPLVACTDIEDAALIVDQRGTPRPFGPQCDSGAVEAQDVLGPFEFFNGFETLIPK